MKKINKKAFTLVELLVAIAIIGLIMAIAIPSIRNLQSNNQETKYEKYGESVLTSAKLYIDSYTKDIFGNSTSGCVDITYSQLKQKNLLKDINAYNTECNIKKDGKDLTFVRVRKSNDQYNYELSIKCVRGKATVYEKTLTGLCNNTPDKEPPEIILTPNHQSDTWSTGKNQEITITVKDDYGLYENVEIKYAWTTDLTNIDEASYTLVPFKNKRGSTTTLTEKVAYPTGVTGQYYFVVEPINVRDVNNNREYNKTQSGVFKIDNTMPTVEITSVVESPDTPVKTINAILSDTPAMINGYAITTSDEQPTSFTEITPTASYNLSKTVSTSEPTYYVWARDVAGNISKQSSTTETTYAVYFQKDASLRFYKTTDKIKVGDKLMVGSKEYAATAVYTGFDKKIYDVELVQQNDEQGDEDNTHHGEWIHFTFNSNVPWEEYATKIKKVVFEDEITARSIKGWFTNFKKCESITNFNNLKDFTDMRYAFAFYGSNKSTVSLDLSELDTSKVTNFAFAFYKLGHKSTTKIQLTGLNSWDTSNVTNMEFMFSGAGHDNATTFTIDDLSTWNLQNTIDTRKMFFQCGYKAKKIALNLTNWNVSNVTDMDAMFHYLGYSATNGWTIGDLSGWLVGKVTDMNHMFHRLGYSYTGEWSIGDLSNWDVSNVVNMESMFRQIAQKSTKDWYVGDLTNWNVSNVTNMREMFNGAAKDSTATFKVNLTNWNVSNVKDMSYMFSYTGQKVTSWTIGDLSGWEVGNVTDMNHMFYQAGSNLTKTTTWNIGNISNWNTSNVTDMNNMFYQTAHKTTYTHNLSNWNVSKVTNHKNFVSTGGTSTADSITQPNWIS